MNTAGTPPWTQLPAVQSHGESLGLYATGDPGRPVVLLLHGLEDGWSSWEDLARWLVPHYRCVAVDLPWRTAGDYRWRRRPAEQWIADVVDRVRASAIVAHSFSANALLQGLARAELAADMMVLISPFYRPPSVPVDWRTFEHSLADFRTTMTAGLRIRLGARAARIEPDVFARMASAMLDGIGVLGFLAVFEQFATASNLDLSACPGRALIVAGSRDPGIAGERAEWLHRAIPHAVMAVDPDYSHFCHLDQPDLIGPLVADFLQEGTAPMGTLEGTSGPYTGRPRYEGANISTFIGFKNFTALAEDAVLHHLRELGFGPQRLFEQYGLGVTIVHSSVRLTATMHTDDLVVGTVTPVAAKPGQGAAFDVKLATQRGDEDVKLLNGRMRVQLVAEKDGRPVEPVPAELAPFVVAEVATAGAAEPFAATTDSVPSALTAASGNDFAWSWKIPYFACHYYTRIQHSAYVKLLEEAVDRYLEHVGLPITGLLEHRDWIPVVSRARVDLHADAFMGEELLITFAVDDVIKDTLFTARMECRVLRGDRLVHIASATIMHGYVLARGEDAFQDLVVLDAPTQAALLGGAA
jgi:pimeloyl-ACP methyl ester carboxylesterase/acyl-CoA thioesterase FadM